MYSYLNSSELATRINLEKEIEQWLSYEREEEYTFIRWLAIRGRKNKFTVTYFESFDEGDEDFYDVSAFSVLDPEDAPYGIEDEFESIEEAVAFAVETYGAAADRFVAGGMIQEEYAKHLHRNK